MFYGATKLVFSLRERRGLLIFTRVFLLDTSYLHYENVMIGFVLTMLHARRVILTIFPHYNVSLRDHTMMVLAPFLNWFLGELRCGLAEANGWNEQGWLQWSYDFLEGA